MPSLYAGRPSGLVAHKTRQQELLPLHPLGTGLSTLGARRGLVYSSVVVVAGGVIFCAT